MAAANQKDAGTIPGVLHNLHGQKMGRKGRTTRDRILAAAIEQIYRGGDVPISLSSVARHAEISMTSIYNYFADLTELVLGILDPVMVEADAAYVDCLRTRWPDEYLADQASHLFTDSSAFGCIMLLYCICATLCPMPATSA